VFGAEQLKLLKTEDNHAIVSLDGKLVSIEQAVNLFYRSSGSGESGPDLPLAARTRTFLLGSTGGEAAVYSLNPSANSCLQHNSVA
jgi:hypothetical protein